MHLAAVDIRTCVCGNADDVQLDEPPGMDRLRVRGQVNRVAVEPALRDGTDRHRVPHPGAENGERLRVADHLGRPARIGQAPVQQLQPVDPVEWAAVGRQDPADRVLAAGQHRLALVTTGDDRQLQAPLAVSDLRELSDLLQRNAVAGAAHERVDVHVGAVDRGEVAAVGAVGPLRRRGRADHDPTQSAGQQAEPQPGAPARSQLRVEAYAKRRQLNHSCWRPLCGRRR